MTDGPLFAEDPEDAVLDVSELPKGTVDEKPPTADPAASREPGGDDPARRSDKGGENGGGPRGGLLGAIAGRASTTRPDTPPCDPHRTSLISAAASSAGPDAGNGDGLQPPDDPAAGLFTGDAYRIVDGRYEPETWWTKLRDRIVAWSKSEREQALEDVDSRLNRLHAKGVRNGHVIAVGSAKGGTGKDALAVTLGDTIATALRGAPTLVLDGDWDFGTLGKRAPEEGRSPGTILDVYEHRDELVSPAQIGGFVARMSSGCHLLSAPRDPEAMERLQVQHYAEVVTALHRFYSVIFVTMAPGVMAPICRWAFAAADRIVFVTDTRLITADQTLRALAFLRNRHPDTPLYLAINQVPARPSQPQQRMIDVQANNHMSTSVVQVPWDERLEQQLDSGTFTLEDPELSAATKLALKRAALAIAEGLVCEEER